MDLTLVSRTTLWTLYLRAVDARRRRPALGDRFAAAALERIGADTSGLGILRGDARTIATRARLLDDWTRDFCSREPHGQVLGLASGLDSRVLRVDPPSTVRWTDSDLPDVAELRRVAYDLPDRVRTVGASADDDALWADFPDDRPTFVVAEGLLMYLEPATVDALLARLERRGAPLEVCFDVVAGWVLPVSRLLGLVARDDVRFRWSASSAAAVVERHPRLRVLDDVPLTPLLAREAVPGPGGRLLAASTRLSPLGGAMRVVRLASGAGQAQSCPSSASSASSTVPS